MGDRSKKPRSGHTGRTTCVSRARWQGAGALLLLCGCASQGPLKPPTLNLPEPPAAATAERVADTVRLQWTTSGKTTDGDGVRGAITAAICLDETRAQEVAEQAEAARIAGRRDHRQAANLSSNGCKVLLEQPVTPGQSEAQVPLPAALRTGEPRLAAVRVELRNALGRSAGWSAPLLLAAGQAPAEVGHVAATPARESIVLQWTAQPGTDAVMELVRSARLPSGASAAAAATKPKPAAVGRPFAPHTAAKSDGSETLRAGSAGPDPGGVVDRDVRDGATYTYTAQRVRTVTLAGRTLELRSSPSEPVSVTYHDVFPPAPPAGLVLVPGEAPSLDLAWRSGEEPDLLGYNVYRRTGPSGEFVRLNAEPGAEPSFRDLKVEPGRQYTYRVTAVDVRHNESAPSAEVSETLRRP